MNFKRISATILVGGGLLALALWGGKMYQTHSGGTAAAGKAPVATNAAAAHPLAKATPGPRPGGPTPVPRPNPAVPRPVQQAGVRTNGAGPLAHPGAKPGTNVLASSGGTNASPSWVDSLKQLPQSSLFYPVAGGVFLTIIVLLVFRAYGDKKKAAASSTALTVPSKAFKGNGTARAVHACNVLEVGSQGRQVWHFDARNGNFKLNRQQTSRAGEALPSLVGKDWRSLFQPKLNVAWLPPENVFLRVIQLPRSDANETLAMLELQLEKLSPMPVAQVVWSFQVLPHTEGNLQTVIVILVGRSVVEEFLGHLEGQGYLADRLELPVLDQLQATSIKEDGAWIYPEAGQNRALVAWWYGGVLQNLDLLTLPAENQAEGLREQLMQMAWAGELEGWLTAPPSWHLVADAGAANWEPLLRKGLDQPVDQVTPVDNTQLAALTARRSVAADPRANLLPPEFALRYKQQFHDRLWMRSLFAVCGIYIVGVAIYMIALGVASYRTSAVESQVSELGQTYTNTIQLRDRYQVLKEREELKFAALDCWNTTARLLPENVTLDSMNFSDGKKLTLSGTAPADQVQQLYQFEANMRKAPGPDNQPLFDATKGDSLTFRANGPTATWSLGLELKRTETQ